MSERKIYFLSHERAPGKLLLEVSAEDMKKMREGGDTFGQPVYWSPGIGVWPKFLSGFLMERIAEKDLIGETNGN